MFFPWNREANRLAKIKTSWLFCYKIPQEGFHGKSHPFFNSNFYKLRVFTENISLKAINKTK